MASISEIMKAATEHHRSGRLELAAQGYQEVLKMDPQQPDTWHMLGILFFQMGNNREAASHLEKAVSLRPDDVSFRRNLGVIREAMQDFSGAIQCYREVLKMQPGDAGAHYCLANGLKAGGEIDEALDQFRKAVELNPNFAEAHNNLGSLLKQRGEHSDAVASYQRAIEVKPDYAEAYLNLGSTQLQNGELEAAEASVNKAISLNPTLAEAHRTLAVILLQRGELERALESVDRALKLKPGLGDSHKTRGDILRSQNRFSEAVSCYQNALQCNPASAEIYNDLGNLLQQTGMLDEASACYKKAVELSPEFARAYNNWGAVAHKLERPEEAVGLFEKAIRYGEDVTEAHINLGNVLRELGRLDEAEACYRNAVWRDPSSLQAFSQLAHQLKQLCAWDDLAEVTEQVFALFDKSSEPVPLFNFLCLPSSAEQQLLCAERHAKSVQKQAENLDTQFAFKKPNQEDPRKIRLGYVSVDFREHAITYLVTELIEKHSRERFEVIGYSYGPDDGSQARQRLASAFDKFVDIRECSPAAAAKRIYDDEIDIILDLTGYLPRAREEILAHRPAPIQMNFLGFAATSGADWMDYIVVDPFVVAPGGDQFISEKTVCLPDCYLVTDSERDISSETPSRKECGLPEEGVVFCSFNQSHKITPEIFQVWLDLLAECEGSVLWLWQNNSFARRNLELEAGKRGIDPSRLVFAQSLPQAEHLARYRLADLALDTFPYNGHTTTSDALWVGCPVLTYAGETFSSRVAGSVLTAGGLSGLITYSLEEYRSVGLELVRNPERMAEYRNRLHINWDKSPLFDCERYAGNLENALEQMWDLYTAGSDPRPIVVTSD